MPSTLQFAPYTRDFAADFKRINAQWIEEMFTLEPVDIAMLDDPQSYVLDKGGYIWLAQHPDVGVVGTCALLNMAEGVFELTKMGVSREARGLGVGQRLLAHVLEQVGQLPIQRLFLLTNHKCAAAIHLYEKYGFVHDAQILREFGGEYSRCDVAMNYPL